jgi:hypothetical protein
MTAQFDDPGTLAMGARAVAASEYIDTEVNPLEARSDGVCPSGKSGSRLSNAHGRCEICGGDLRISSGSVCGAARLVARKPV